jgi:hypothetical protein
MQRQLDFRALPRSSAPYRSQWKERRVQTVREIRGRPSELFCGTASKLLEHYLALTSAAQPDRSKQAQLAGFVMDFAGRMLFKGHRIGPKRKHQLMQQLAERVEGEAQELMAAPSETVVPAMTAATTEAAAGSSAAPPCIAEPIVIFISDSDSVAASDAADAQPRLCSHVPEEHRDNAPECTSGLIDNEAPSHGTTSRDTLILATVRRAAMIVAQGGPHHIQRAARALSSAPLAELNAHNIRALLALHPKAVTPMGELPARATGIGDIDPKRLERVLRTRVYNGSAPGQSGWTGSHLLELWERASPEGRLGFQLLIRDLCNGVFAGELKQRLLSCVLVPLSKPGNGVRPVAVAEVWVRCAAHYMISLIEEDMHAFFPRIQFGVKHPGGSETAAQLTRAELAYAATKHSEVIALKTDFKNAFNAISRAKVWAALLAHPQAEPILKAFHWQYSDASPLLVYENSRLFAELHSSDGVRQGCPFAAFAFALTVQPLYEAALRQAPDCNGFSIQDDFTLVGPAKQVMAAYDYLKQHAHAQLGLELVTAKCQVFVPPAVTALPDADARIHALCTERQLPFAPHMESLGVMFGDTAAVTAHCESAVTASEHFFECLSHPAMPTQTAALLLRYCALPKLGYLARTTHPDALAAPAARFDAMALSTQLRMLQLSDASLTALQPRLSDPDSRVHDPGETEPPPGSQPQLSTERSSCVSKEQLLTRMALPLSLGGLGLRPVLRIRHAAYYAALLQILPAFAHLHPELRDVVAWQHTQLYAELTQCREALLAAGAANSFAWDSLASPASSGAEPHDLLRCAAATHSHNATATPPEAGRAAASAEPAAGSTSALAAAPSLTAAPADAAPAAVTFLATRFPSPSLALTQSLDDSWQQAVQRSAHTHSAQHVQRALTRSLEATAWMHLFNSSGRYQQAILTSLTLNPSTSAWLSTPPLRELPAYRMRDEEYMLAVRHRLGMLPYDDLRDELCVSCGKRNLDTPALLVDPDHMHSCTLQHGASVTQRHDALKLALAELARSCGYLVEVEPSFPAHVTTHVDEYTGEQVHSSSHTLARGDLLLLRNNTRELVDVTVVRPTCLTELRGSATAGSHIAPLASATRAEAAKHRLYDAECAKHGWKLVPFAMESYGAKGAAASRLLQRMSAHALERSPEEFLSHAERVLSIALQSGNARVSAAGTATLHHQAYRRGCDDRSAGSSRTSLTRRQQASRSRGAQQDYDLPLSALVHASYHSARTRGAPAA